MAVQCLEVGSMTELVRRATAGDAEAWEAIVQRYASWPWAVARAHRLSYAEAADVAQTTWLRLVQYIGQIREPEAIGAWLTTTARRESIRMLRLAGREQLVADDDLGLEVIDLRPDADPENRAVAADLDVVVRQAIGELPTLCQDVLGPLLLADPPPTYQELSARLDMPLGSIGPTRGRCLARLRSRLRHAGVEV